MFNIKSCDINYCKSLKLSKGGRERHWLAKPLTLGENPSLLLQLSPIILEVLVLTHLNFLMVGFLYEFLISCSMLGRRGGVGFFSFLVLELRR
jgi:hypothetical protein